MKDLKIPRSHIISEKYKKNNCNHWYVKCECLCGKVLEQRINKHGGLCCKCRSKFFPPPIKKQNDLTGKKIGTRTVEKQYYNPDDQQVYVDIICDCGAKYSTRKCVFLNSKFCNSCKNNYIYNGHRKKYLVNDNKKRCTKCNSIKEISDFYTDKSKLDSKHPICKKCHSLQTKIKKYNITKEQAIELSNSKCEICNSDKNVFIDHCHETGKVRGSLCQSCNFGIGCFKDDVILLDNAIKYLEKNNALN